MSDSPFFGGGDMFKNMLNDLMRLVPANVGVQWPMAYQLASQIALGDAQGEPTPDPIERIKLEELCAIAELHVEEVTGMSVLPGGGRLTIRPATRGEWARGIIDSWRPVLDRLAEIIAPASPPSQPAPAADTSSPAAPDPAAASSPVAPGSANPGTTSDADAGLRALFEAAGLNDTPDLVPASEPDDDISDADPEERATAEMAGMFDRLMGAMFPSMIAMQVGSVAGHLSERAIGQYDIPLAPAVGTELLVVTANLAKMAEDWSLPLDDLRLWLCVREMVCHAVLSRPGIAQRIADLVVTHTRLAQPDAEAMSHMLDGADPSDPATLANLFGAPGAMRGSGQNAELDRVRAELDAIMAAVAGYVEHVTGTIADRIIGNHTPIGEAMRRRRVSRGEGEKVAEALFGLSLDQGQVDRGAGFVAGVLERSGEIQLAQMWADPARLPTPTEIDAPGLWLARLELPSESDD